MQRLTSMKQLLYTLLFAILMLPSTSNAQAGLDLLNKVENKLLDAHELTLSMELNLFIPGNAEQLIQGKFVKKGDKYLLISDIMDMISDGNLTWSINKQEKVAYVTNVGDEGGISPIEIIRDYDKEDYEFNLIPDYQEGDESYTAIVLKPKARNADYTKIRFLIDENDNLYNFFLVSRSGERTTLTITQLEYRTTVEENSFKFSEHQYPGIALEDLRLD